MLNKEMIDKLKGLIETQSEGVNWNDDHYMRGMHNGMEYMMSVIEGRNPVYKDSDVNEIHPL